MSTSETSTASIDNKIKILAVIPSLKGKEEWADRFASLWDISIPLAVAVQQEWVTELSDRGTEEIDRCFLALADLFEQTEAELLELMLNAIE